MMTTTWLFQIDWERVAPPIGQPEDHPHNGLYNSTIPAGTPVENNRP
jgi:hypothetical protein